MTPLSLYNLQSHLTCQGEKLGPNFLQFPKFDKSVLKGPDEFRTRLETFFKRAEDLKAGRFAVEVRSKDWLDARLTDVLRDHNVALALTDTSFMPRPWEVKGALDLVTADFTYVRWLGNRKGIEGQTTTWDKTVINRQDDLRSWAVVLRHLAEDKRIGKIFAFSFVVADLKLNARAELFRRVGHEVISVPDNEAAKRTLTAIDKVDVFIVGHTAPEQTRKEMVDWLMAISRR